MSNQQNRQTNVGNMRKQVVDYKDEFSDASAEQAIYDSDIISIRTKIERTGTKSECPHHTFDAYGRPIPPAGYCGPLCWMRPTSALEGTHLSRTMAE